MLRDARRADFSDKSIARLRTHGERFEIVLNPKLSFEYRTNPEKRDELDMREILEIDEIFRDATKGERVTEESLEIAFGTHDIVEIAQEILIKGELQIAAQQRNELIDKKKKQIVAFIARNCVDPSSPRKLPHPPNRIERAMKEAKVSIDVFRPAHEQAREIVNQLKTVLPIRMEQVTIAIRIPAEFTGSAYGVVKRFGDVSKEEWQKDGSWIGVITIPAGLEADFVDRIGSNTKGHAEIKTLSRDTL